MACSLYFTQQGSKNDSDLDLISHILKMKSKELLVKETSTHYLSSLGLSIKTIFYS